jgi:hypothetical protein
MVIGADTPDQPKEPPKNDDEFRRLFGRDPSASEGIVPPPEEKEPEPNSMDLISQMFGVDPVMMDKVKLASQIDGILDRTLKFLQVIHYAREIFGEQEADKLARHYRAGIELLAESADEAVKLFQKKYGEI